MLQIHQFYFDMSYNMSYILLVRMFLLISAVWKRGSFGRATSYAKIMFLIAIF